MQSILITILTCNAIFYPDRVWKTLNYFNLASLEAGTQHRSNCQQQESSPERNTGEQKTEESLIQLGSVMTSAVPRWRPREITSGAWMSDFMAVHQDPKITPSPREPLTSPHFPLIILGSSGECDRVQNNNLISFICRKTGEITFVISQLPLRVAQ